MLVFINYYTGNCLPAFRYTLSVPSQNSEGFISRFLADHMVWHAPRQYC